MSEPSRDDLRAIWRQLAKRNDWALVDDEEAFIDTAITEFRALDAERAPNQRPWRAIERAYSLLLYNGLLNKHERAAYELWLACVRLSSKHGWPQDAEEMAQETIYRVLEKLPSLLSPQSLLAWTFQLLRRVEREYVEEKQQLASQPQADEVELVAKIADPTDMAALIEQKIINQELLLLLRKKLPNPTERLVVLRMVGLGDHPRDVARDLGIPLHQTRVAKSRALKRLRADPELQQALLRLTTRAQPEAPGTGAENDES